MLEAAVEAARVEREADQAHERVALGAGREQRAQVRERVEVKAREPRRRLVGEASTSLLGVLARRSASIGVKRWM